MNECKSLTEPVCGSSCFTAILRPLDGATCHTCEQFPNEMTGVLKAAEDFSLLLEHYMPMTVVLLATLCSRVEKNTPVFLWYFQHHYPLPVPGLLRERKSLCGLLSCLLCLPPEATVLSGRLVACTGYNGSSPPQWPSLLLVSKRQLTHCDDDYDDSWSSPSWPFSLLLRVSETACAVVQC